MYRVRQYGLNTWLIFLTRVKNVDAKLLSGGFYDATNITPQEYLFRKIGPKNLRRCFGDWAAQNTGGMNYLSKEQVKESYQGVNNWDLYRPAVWYGVNNGTGVEWFRPSVSNTARGWAYNVFNITNTLNTTYTFHLQGDAKGSQGAPAFFIGRIVVLTPTAPLYHTMTMTSPLAGNKSVSVTQNDSQLMLVVVSVPQNFHGYQHYSYRVRINTAEETDEHYYTI